MSFLNTSSARNSLAITLLLAAVGVAHAAPNFDALPKRDILAKPNLIAMPVGDHRLVVKFRDDLRARASLGRAVANARPLPQVEALARTTGMTLHQLIDLDDHLIDRVELTAAQRTGVAPADLRAMMVVSAPKARLEFIANRLLAMDSVEWVDFEPLTPTPPPCDDIAPATGNFVANQVYRGPNPGINIDAAWALGDARGQGVAIADIEYGYHPDHEDLCGVIPEPNQTISSFVFERNWHTHGTAVLGILNATENAYGVTGLAPLAQAYFFPENTVQQGSRRATAILNASATLDPGDIIVLEMQTTGGGGQFGPAEYSLSVWNATKVATDAGRIVIAAAGNGNENMDGVGYNSYRARGDSGAIIVGAGTADTIHRKLDFSTFGSRVNVQGWGQSVATTGYGNLARPGNDDNQAYTSSFNGTSSATPVVAGAAASLQSLALATYNTPLTPQAMRDLLMDTGIPQGANGFGGNIGPFPNVVAARAALPEYIGEPPLPTDLLAPSDASTITAPAVFTWSPVEAAATYTITIDNDPDFSSPTITTTTLNTAFTLARDLTPGTYHWQVATTNGIGSSYSTPRTFIIATPCPTDLDSSGATDLTDLNTLLAAFGTTAAGDTNNDGTTDLADLNALLAAFGTPCP